MPVARSTTLVVVSRRKRPDMPRNPDAEATRARKDSARPVAARSCITASTGIGTRPTTIMWAPAEASDHRMPREVRRPIDDGRSAASSIP
ncbi:hypothetical protein GCM10027411_13050 [Microbacterium aureliae]